MSLAAPRNVAAYADASALAGAALPQSTPGSLYVHGTSLALMRLSSYVALFAATCGYVRGMREAAILGAVILSVGFAAALIGILQSISGADSILWLRKAPHGGFFGPFVGRNQYAAYAAVCTFVGIGLLLVRSERWVGARQSWRNMACGAWPPRRSAGVRRRRDRRVRPLVAVQGRHTLDARGLRRPSSAPRR